MAHLSTNVSLRRFRPGHCRVCKFLFMAEVVEDEVNYLNSRRNVYRRYTDPSGRFRFRYELLASYAVGCGYALMGKSDVRGFLILNELYRLTADRHSEVVRTCEHSEQVRSHEI